VTQLPSAGDPSIFALLVCEAQGPDCTLRQNPIGTNRDNWYFWTTINGSKLEFAAFGGHKLTNGIHWFECINCTDTAVYLELISRDGKANEFGVFTTTQAFAAADYNDAPYTVTPEPATGLLVASGLAIIARKLHRRIRG
jgi:hypothetical protein